MYSLLLHKYAYVLLLTLDGSHHSGYDFNLTDEQKLQAQRLIDMLQTQWEMEQARDQDDAQDDGRRENSTAEEDKNDEDGRLSDGAEEAKDDQNTEDGGGEEEEEADNNNSNSDGDRDEDDDDDDDSDDDEEEQNEDEVLCDDDENYDSPLVQMFHDFIRPFLYPLHRPLIATGPPCKWDHPIERFMAMYSLRGDGNFRQAKEVTQMFATFHYHIRGTILYEGLSRCEEDFDGDPYRYVLQAFLDQKSSSHIMLLIKVSDAPSPSNIPPGSRSPYVICQNYQRLATAIAKNVNAPPTT
jgi:hypothetical protein